jgi:hypothetical protein
MGQFVQTNGDYNIKTAEGGQVTLDTGPGVGTVRVTGNLLVEGEQLTVSANNLNIKDNIIILNDGETGAGVTMRYAGVQIDRGSDVEANLLFDENDNSWNFVFGTTGSYNYADTTLRVASIVTSSTGDLTLIGTGTGVVTVLGTDNYEDQVTHDDDLPNKKYVDDAIQNNPTFQIVSDSAGGQSSSSRVIVSDKDATGSLAYLSSTTGYDTGPANESAVTVIVDGRLNAQFFSNRTQLLDLEISGTEITTRDSITNENINIRTQGTGKLSTNYALQLDQIGVEPAYVSGSTVLYSAPISLGTTGVFFVNDSAEVRHRAGELISKNKALLLSMIF